VLILFTKITKSSYIKVVRAISLLTSTTVVIVHVIDVVLQNISTSLVSQEPAPLMANHLTSAVVKHYHNKLSPVEMDELMLDDGVYSP